MEQPTTKPEGQSSLTRAQEDEIIRVYIRAMYWNRNLGFRPQVRALTAEVLPLAQEEEGKQ